VYDGPNKDKKSALDIFEKAVEEYNYGGERNNKTHNTMIFMPTATNHPSCVIEWKESRPKWVERGMSANAEDVTIFDAFFSSDLFRGGNHTYMEIGAHDGVRESNSRFYDICLGWNGLLVEPHPKNYERTVRLRPNAHHLGIAPSCMANESGTILFPEHMFTSAQVNEEGSKIEIHCGPLQYYLDALEIFHIDFWSLDVEGSELKVLETVDFDRTHVDVIIAESQNRLSHLPEIQKKVEDVRLYLQRKGYLMIRSVSVHKSDVFLHKRACGIHGDIQECSAIPLPHTSYDGDGQAEKASSDNSIGHSQKSITCDASPCNGFFVYDGPNKDKKSALDIFEKAVEEYNYGGERNNKTHNTMIFMPTATNHPSCVIEWKESRPKWVERGMSANAEDVTIFDAFFSSDLFRGGNHTYMEIGAHDGVRESNSRFYDICLGWNGLLVEPHPKNYERTVRLRPNAHHLGIAPSCMANESGTILFPEHMFTSAQVNEEGSKIEIHCGPLQYYLDALEIFHIDFWSLDVEGSELKVLETVDFDRTHVDVIIAESQNRLSHLPEIQKKVEDVRLYLQRKGYLMIRSVSVHKSDVFLHKRACGIHGDIQECKGVV